MHRLARIVLNTLTALSLLLCLAAGIFWIRSYSLSDQLSWVGNNGPRTVHSAHGHLVINLLFADWSPNPSFHHSLRYERNTVAQPFNELLFLSGEPNDVDASHKLLGFAWYSKSRGNQTPYVIIVIPFWSIVAIAAILPLIRATRRFFPTGQPKSKDHCPTCHYDLRATPNRCPECGTQIQ